MQSVELNGGKNHLQYGIYRKSSVKRLLSIAVWQNGVFVNAFFLRDLVTCVMRVWENADMFVEKNTQ